jgi:hypothetical protein
MLLFCSSSYLTLITNLLDNDQTGSERQAVYRGVGKHSKYCTEYVVEIGVTIHTSVTAKEIYWHIGTILHVE